MGKLEIWRSQIAGRQGVKAIGPDGVQTTIFINGGTEFGCTPEERRLTQKGAAKGLDPFTNGVFALVDSSDDADDKEAIEAAAEGHLSDDDIRALITTAHPTVRKTINEIKSTLTLRRIEAIFADEEEGASPAKVRLVRERLAALGVDAVVGVGPAKSDHPAAERDAPGIDGFPAPDMRVGTPDGPMTSGMPAGLA